MLLFQLVMKFSSITDLIKKVNSKKVDTKTIADYNREVMVRQGREQFKKLLDKGLNIPVALL